MGQDPFVAAEEMDLFLAEEVMGWVWKDPGILYAGWGWWVERDAQHVVRAETKPGDTKKLPWRKRRTEDSRICERWSPMENIQHARELLVPLNRKGWRLTVMQRPGISRWAAALENDKTGDTTYSGLRSSEAEAICYAAFETTFVKPPAFFPLSLSSIPDPGPWPAEIPRPGSPAHLREHLKEKLESIQELVQPYLEQYPRRDGAKRLSVTLGLLREINRRASLE